MKLQISNATFTVTLVERNGCWEFKEVLTEFAFDTKYEAIEYLRKLYGKNISVNPIKKIKK